VTGPTPRQVEVHAAVIRHGGHQARAAAELGVSRATVTRVLQSYERHLLTRAPRARQPSIAQEAVATNLLTAINALSEDDVAEGKLWWPRAADEVAWLANFYDVAFERLAYAAAALSPGLRWTATLDALRMLLDARAAGAAMPTGSGHLTFGYRDRAKAWAILTESQSQISLCRGPKVEAIAANLLGDLDQVAVDRHVVRAATGREDLRQVSPSAMRRIAAAVRLLAVVRGLRPAELQAAIWCAATRRAAA
jgi:hypothetical protein